MSDLLYRLRNGLITHATREEAALEIERLRSAQAALQNAIEQLHGPLSVAALVARAEAAEEKVRAIEENRK